MKWNDTKNIINHILAKDFGKIFIEIIILGLHIWSISLENPISMYLKIILCIIFLIILIYLIIDVKTAIKLFAEKHIPIVVAVGRSDDDVSAMVSDVLDSMNEYNFDERTFEDNIHITRDNWLVERKSPLPDDPGEWVSFVHRFEDKIVRLSAMPGLRGRKVFHLFLKCPSALAMGLGAVTGIYQETVLHHLQPGTGSAHPYLPLIDFSARSDFSRGGIHDIKSKMTRPHEYICVEALETLTNVLPVSLHLSGHDPESEVDKLASRGSLSAVHIRNTYNNTLTVDADWFRAAHEVADVCWSILPCQGREDRTLSELSCYHRVCSRDGSWDACKNRGVPVGRGEILFSILPEQIASWSIRSSLCWWCSFYGACAFYAREQCHGSQPASPQQVSQPQVRSC